MIGSDVESVISDEEALQEIFDEDAVELDAEVELDFSVDRYEDGGHIYESIEAEVGQAADDAADELDRDEFSLDSDFDEELPEEFFANDALGG